ncbi:MAG TPA: ammonium transporter [Nocardioidaceae bacterium]|nr:ammonium transporter [Nocardioidaceae bacterium]
MHLDTGDTAWVLVATALVLLMTPGLAFFYGGMVRAKSVLNMLMMSFSAIGIVSLLWVLFGYSVAFGDSSESPWSGLWGGLGDTGLTGMAGETTVNGAPYAVPVLVFAAFQLMFAIITPALISGAVADRTKFGPWMAFVAIWTTLVYFPVAHWVFDMGGAGGGQYGGDRGHGAGWLAHLGVLDFAGGTAVHVNAGAAALALAIVLGRRIGWRRDPMPSHNPTLVMLGAGLLWFGWFGFNAGSALSANATAGLAFLNTQLAAAAAMLGWMVVERLRDGHYTTLGSASGAVAGLVAITPACAFVSPIGACVLGLVAGCVCAVAVSLKWRLGFDDSLDVVGVHLVGGATGSIGLGFLATDGGLVYGGGLSLLGIQVLAVAVVGVFSFTVAFAVGTLLERTVGFRLSADQEMLGVDRVCHGEEGHVKVPSWAGPGLFPDQGPAAVPVRLEA